MKMTIVALAACMAAGGANARLDHAAWNDLLSRYVNNEARVDYQALNDRDLKALDSYLDRLAQPWPKDVTAADSKAALINAYNALTVRWMAANYPTESIWRTHHPFTDARHTLDVAKVSLDQIETRLRNLGDPRIHGALVCASLSCPPLRREAYEGVQLHRQLDENVRTWLANTQLNQFEPEQRAAKVSMIYKWYAADFRKSYGSVEKFLAQYGPAGKTAFLLQPGARLEYLPYRWGINDTSDRGASYSGFQFYRDAVKNKYF